MKPALYEVTGKNRYCGPTAIATILGVSTDHAAAMIRGQTGRRSAMRVSVRDLAAALEQAGCSVSRYSVIGPLSTQPTVAAWLRGERGIAGGLPKHKHVVLVHGSHFGTILGTRYLCSLTSRSTVPLKSIPKRRARVSGWLVIDRLPASEPVPLERQRAADPERKARTQAKALSARYGIEIEKSGDSIIVWGLPDLEDAQDPHAGDHYADGWADALERVRAYVAIVQRRNEPPRATGPSSRRTGGGTPARAAAGVPA